METRISALARNLLDYSLSLQPEEKLLLEGATGCEELVRGLIAEAYARGAQPFFEPANALSSDLNRGGGYPLGGPCVARQVRSHHQLKKAR